MSRIRGRGNKKTEIALIRLMREHGIKGWRRHRPVFGKPDFVFPGRKVAVFVDGCFWHGCPDHYNVPQNNFEFWRKKLIANRERDGVVTSTLESRGWTVLRFWQHELKKSVRDSAAERIRAALVAGESSDSAHGGMLMAAEERAKYTARV